MTDKDFEAWLDEQSTNDWEKPENDGCLDGVTGRDWRYVYGLGARAAWAKAQDEIELNEKIIKSKTQSLYEMSQIKRQYESNIKSLKQQADKLVEACEKLIDRAHEIQDETDNYGRLICNQIIWVSDALKEYQGEE